MRTCETQLKIKFKYIKTYYVTSYFISIVFTGYWREVVNQTATPNEGYIIVTMDDACIVHIERKEIARLYEGFQEKMPDQDHLIVDVHLSTFAESENLQKTLIVKVRRR